VSKGAIRRLWSPGSVSLAVVVAVVAALGAVGAAGATTPAGNWAPSPEDVPTMVNYQGVVNVGGTAYEGTGYFKFAIVDAASGNGTASYWANDGTAGGEPGTPVALAVEGGLFNVLLGDTSLAGMSQPIDETVFAAAETYLRVWFSTTGAAGSFVALEPNQRIASVAYALHARYAENAPQGATGATGPTGPQGLVGATGAPGATGPQGPEGATGAQGPAGLTGPSGPSGPTGPQGLAGATGATGAQGPAGLTGPSGPSGPTGAQGPAGLTGPSGPSGSTGPQGLAGATGATGPQGPQGLVGATGPQGPVGATGATGPSGPSGPTGPTDLCGYSQSCTGAGLSLSTSGSGSVAVSGSAPSGTGVYGSGGAYGVHGTVALPTSFGVFGENTDMTSGAGVLGYGYAGVYGTGDAFGVYGDGYYGVWGEGEQAGVYGYTENWAAYGVYGQSTNTDAGVGVYGTGLTGVQGDGSYAGVYGAGGTGVYGTGSSYGVYGVNSNTSSGYGVYGDGYHGVYGTGDVYGVYGDSTWYGVWGDGDFIGVYGLTENGTYGVQGVNTNNTSGFGVYGSGHTGVYGVGFNTGVFGSGNPYGVHGYSSGATGFGVFGENANTTDTTYGGVRGNASGSSNINAGTLGYSTSSNGFGAVGWNYWDGVGVGAWSFSGNLIEAYNGDYPYGGLRFYVDSAGNLHYDGALQPYAEVPSPDGSGVERRSLFGMASPEAWLEDFGSATLKDGQATVSIDPVFAQTVNLAVEYHVYLTPVCTDLILLGVTYKGPDSFTVQGATLDGKPSACSFDYRIVAKQRGYEGQRLEVVVIEDRPQPARSAPGGGTQ